MAVCWVVRVLLPGLCEAGPPAHQQACPPGTAKHSQATAGHSQARPRPATAGKLYTDGVPEKQYMLDLKRGISDQERYLRRRTPPAQPYPCVANVSCCRPCCCGPGRLLGSNLELPLGLAVGS
jgi:hypothetical protein